MSALDQNIKKLKSHLSRFENGGIKHRIAGEDVAGGGGFFTTTSPVDKSAICEVARGDAGDIDKAAKAAKVAFPTWRDIPAKERKAIMIRIAEGIEARAEEPPCAAPKTFATLLIKLAQRETGSICNHQP